MEIGERRVSSRELNGMIILKKDIKTKMPKVLIKDNVLYKLESTHIASRLKSYFEILSEIHELANCIFPKEILYDDSKECGYTTEYLSEYKNIKSRIAKNNLSTGWKKEIIYKIINLIKNLHLNGVVHNDLHCYNILNTTSDIKLIDFDQLKIRGLESDYMYMAWLKREINYLNLLILSILFETNLSYITLEEEKLLIDELTIFSEFKEYLNNCLDFKEEKVTDELTKYVNSITGKDIVKGKELVKLLKI